MNANHQLNPKLLLAAALIILVVQLHKLLILSHGKTKLGKTMDAYADAPMDEPTQFNDDDRDVDAPMLLESNETVNNATLGPLPWSLPKVQAWASQQSSKDFMDELNQLKRSMNISLPWDTNNTTSLPTPIISLNLPKSATLTLYEYFKCGGLTSSHTYIPGMAKGSTQIRIGDCMRDNLLSDDDSPPFQGCDYDNKTQKVIEFYSDIGIPGPSRCFYSSLHNGGLGHIAKYYPNATILMLHRPIEHWINSVQKWGGGRLFGMWATQCGFTGIGGRKCTKKDVKCWRAFYHAHTEKIREFAKKHLHMTYVEVLLDEMASSVLGSYTGISASCLQHCKPGKPKDPNVNLRTYKKCNPIAS